MTNPTTDPRLAKGSTLRSTLAWIAEAAGEEAVERVLARLPEGERARVRAAPPTEEVPFPLLLALLRAADAELAPALPGWAEQAGAHAIAQTGTELYGGILRKRDPMEFLTQRVSLFRLYYHPGDMQVVEAEPGRAVLRLVGFDPGDPLFCRRQTGGLVSSVRVAGGGEATARHVRCAGEGDAFCEWELRWGEEPAGA